MKIEVLMSMILLLSLSLIISTSESVFADTQIITNNNVTLIKPIFQNIHKSVNTENLSKPFIMPYLPKNTTEYLAKKSQLENLLQANNVSSQIPKLNGPAKINQVIPEFDGIDENTGLSEPPDVQIAAGPNHIMEMVNVAGEIWTKSGTPVSVFSFYSFFPVSNSDHISDPKILFDSQSERWFASLIDINTNSVVLAVSKTSDPSDLVNGWVFYNLPFSNCPDQPKIGISDDKLVISANDYTNQCGGNFFGAEYQILNKNQLITGSSVNREIFGPDITNFSLTPAQDLSSTSTLYMVENQDTLVRLYTISGSVPSAVTTTLDRSLQTSNIPPNAAQPGTSIQLDTGDNRIQDAKWYQEKLWLTINDRCVPQGDTQPRSCIHLVQINTGISTIIQDFRIGGIGYYYFYPAIGIDSSGGLDLVFGFSSSSDTRYPSIAVSGQAVNDPPNTIQSLQTLREGSTPDINPVESGFVGTRYGDYFGAALDPSDDKRVWVAGEYQTLPSSLSFQSPWSTFVGGITQLQPPSVPTGLTANAISSNSIRVSWNLSSGATSYNIFRATSSTGSFTTLAGTSTTSPFIDTGLLQSTKYFYEVSASNSVGTSALSTTTSATTHTPTISLNRNSGPVGKSLTVIGNSFTASSSTNVKFNNVIKSTVTTDTAGSFTTTFPVPISPAGNFTVSATDSASNTATITFTVMPTISLSTNFGFSGTEITVTGNGFAAFSPIDVKYNGVIQTTTTTNGNGVFMTTFPAPPSIVGQYLISVVDGSNNIVSAPFSIRNMIPVPNFVKVGTLLTITGIHLTPNSSTQIDYDGALKRTITTNSTGGFVTTINVPQSRFGPHILYAIDAVHNLIATVVVKTTPWGS